MIAGLNDKESKYIEDMQVTFQTEGWKSLTEDVGKRLEFLKIQLLNPKITSDEFRIAQGKADVLAELVGLQGYLEAVVKQAETKALEPQDE